MFCLFSSKSFIASGLTFRSFTTFSIWLFVFLVLSCMSHLYILEINSLSVVSFAISLSFCRLSFHLVCSFLYCAKALKFNQVPLVYFCFISMTLGGGS